MKTFNDVELKGSNPAAVLNYPLKNPAVIIYLPPNIYLYSYETAPANIINFLSNIVVIRYNREK